MYGLKRKFNMRIEVFQKNEEGLKSIEQKWEIVNRKNFLEDLKKEREKGNNIKIEICYAPPAAFQFNTMYVRADGKIAYTYLLKE